MCRKSPISKGINWLCRNIVHAVFVCVAVLVFSVPLRASNQRDELIYEKVAEQEHHIDNTDKTLEKETGSLQDQINKVREKADDAHETLDEYKFSFLVVSGILTIVSLFGFRMSFIRGKESNV